MSRIRNILCRHSAKEKKKNMFPICKPLESDGKLLKMLFSFFNSGIFGVDKTVCRSTLKL